MKKKSSRQLDAEIVAAITNPMRAWKRNAARRRAHLSKVDPKQQFVDLLMQRGSSAQMHEAREVARDLLLEHGVIKRGKVEAVRTIGDSFSGPIYQLTMNVGGKRGVRYWTTGPSSGYDVAVVGSTVDFMTTKGYPPIGRWIYPPPWTRDATELEKKKKEATPKEQFHRYGGFEGNFPESIIRKWIDKWWP